MTPAPAIPVCMTLAAAVFATRAPAQSAAPGTAWPDARPVDPGVADVGPLAQSLRAVPVDLRNPVNFDQVFRLGQGASGEALLGRIDGGVTALFPRSVYEPSRFGDVAGIPPGTQFIIGEPPQWLFDQFGLGEGRPRVGPRTSELSSPLQLRLDPRAALDTSWTPATREDAVAVPRTASVRQLLRRAVEADLSR